MAAYEAVADGVGLLGCEDAEAAKAAAPQGSRRRGVWAAAAAGAAALGCIAYLSSGDRRTRAGDEFQVKQQTWDISAYGSCPQMEVDVEYQDETSGFGMSFDHIPNPDLCCALCQANERCASFTWVKDAGLDGNPAQCWIKGGAGVKMTGAFGKVSGLPPPVPQLGFVQPGHGGEGSTLWCYSLMMPEGTEKELITWQYNHQASIFACDGYAVYSNQQIEVVPGLVTKVVDSDLKCKFGGDSQSALNSWIFIAVWDKICDDAEYRFYDWVVKVDPDCVFFPDRLIQIIPMYKGSQYILNCKFGLHGPIEIFSRNAIDILANEYADSFDGKAPKRCVSEMHFGQWGEDMFIDQCLSNVLGITDRPLEPRMICEDHCACDDFYWCQKGSDRVSYHPFKSVGAYQACMANAMEDQYPSNIPDYLKVMAPAR